MTQSCMQIEALIDKRARGLDEAERLVLEQHLTDCEACRESAGFMRAIAHMVNVAPTELSDLARKRAISGAFSNVVRETEEVRRIRFVGPTAFAVAAAAALVFFVQDGPSDSALHTAPAKVAVQQTQAKANDAKQAAVTAQPQQDWLEASELETRTFAHAEVKLEPGTRVRINAIDAISSSSTGVAAFRPGCCVAAFAE